MKTYRPGQVIEVEKPPVYGTPGFTWEPFEAYLSDHYLHYWLECLTLLREENARLKALNAELLEALEEVRWFMIERGFVYDLSKFDSLIAKAKGEK